MNRRIIRFKGFFLLGLVTLALSDFTPSAMLRAQSPCTSGTGGLGIPCTIGGSITLSGVSNEDGGAFAGGKAACGGAGGGVVHTITNDPVNPAITISGATKNCTITGPFVRNSTGTTVFTFSALTGYAIQGLIGSGVCGVTAGGFMSATITAQTSAGPQTLTAGCPTEPSGETGTATGQISFAPLASVDFGLTFSANIPSGGIGTIDSLTWTLSVVPTSETPTFAGSMAHLASGGGWDTLLTLVNTGTSSGEAVLNFFGDSGSALSLPLTFPQTSSSAQNASSVTQNLNTSALLLIDSQQSGTSIAQGSAQLLTEGNIGGFAIFTNIPTGQAAVVPLETRNAPAYLLAFDNTGGINTGVALANVAATSASIPVIIRDDTGEQIGTDTISLAPHAHTSFMLTTNYGITQNKRGTIEFDTPASGQITALGLRANGKALTTLPVLANVIAGAGSMAHVASGDGWQTTFTLVNTGTSSAQVQLSFFDDNGNALSLPLNFVQTGATSTASTVSQTIAAGASLVIVSNSSSSLTGSAQLSSNGSVGGFAIFAYNPTGQEAVVPLETRNAGSYVLAFDNTNQNSNQLTTGLALANVSSQPAAVPVTIRDDTGATLGTATINLPAQGHTSFMLPSSYAFANGKRGTVEFDTPAGTQISALGLRATSAGAVTTIPVLVK
jgi:hypothetical protein